MTRDELKALYDNMMAAKQRVDVIALQNASFEADLASRKANREWDAAIIAYNKAFDEYIKANPETA